ncbi:agmatine deiminase family protein [Parasphingorhabdus litoris]|uniref:Agmatine deiminase family protein n=1 Tax=Parasphingorhabdus litoris TaxID=394733 RepID=A0ABN1AMD1_9SPHN|nr:agmatine deiminase family protein [Parasphingorhabdus litoris]
MRWPAEWEPHEAVWIGFPGNREEWPEQLAEAQREVAAFANAICDNGNGEHVRLVCRDSGDADHASELVDHKVAILVQPFGDIWLRDTGPIITVGEDRRAHDFGFNGWGRKFEMAGDQDIGRRLAEEAGLAVSKHDWILEGGAIDGDGAGRLITTEQCLLNPNRNQNLTKDLVHQKLQQALNIEHICWLGDGLMADHTDGHVDNLARFVSAGKVTIPKARNADDTNADIYNDAANRAETAGLDVVRIPSVGLYEIDGDIAPASYINFYIGNTIVAVPQYGASSDGEAVQAIAELFPDRRVVGLSSTALLRGGGSFHCISQQIPQL